MTKIEYFDLQRKVVSHMVSKSWENIPHVCFVYEPDMTEFVQRYEKLPKVNGKKISFNTLMLRMIVEGLKSAPKLNATLSYHPKTLDGVLTIHEEINISIPWLLPNGKMITPVVQQAQSKSLNELAQSIVDLEKKIENTDINELLYSAGRKETLTELKNGHLGVLRRLSPTKKNAPQLRTLSKKERKKYANLPEEKRLTAENLLSGTITVSNIGSLYKNQKGFLGLLEIIPPQIMAIGIGALQEKPGVYVNVVGEKKIGIRKTLPICIAFDHRAVDFNDIVPFLKALDKIIEEPNCIKTW